MDPNKNNTLNSWSIPKKPPPPQQSQSQSQSQPQPQGRPSISDSVPRKSSSSDRSSYSSSGGGGPPISSASSSTSTSMSIPRKNPSYHPPPSGNTTTAIGGGDNSSSTTTTIPRKQPSKYNPSQQQQQQQQQQRQSTPLSLTAAIPRRQSSGGGGSGGGNGGGSRPPHQDQQYHSNHSNHPHHRNNHHNKNSSSNKGPQQNLTQNQNLPRSSSSSVGGSIPRRGNNEGNRDYGGSSGSNSANGNGNGNGNSGNNRGGGTQPNGPSSFQHGRSHQHPSHHHHHHQQQQHQQHHPSQGQQQQRHQRNIHAGRENFGGNGGIARGYSQGHAQASSKSGVENSNSQYYRSSATPSGPRSHQSSLTHTYSQEKQQQQLQQQQQLHSQSTSSNRRSPEPPTQPEGRHLTQNVPMSSTVNFSSSPTTPSMNNATHDDKAVDDDGKILSSMLSTGSTLPPNVISQNPFCIRISLKGVHLPSPTTTNRSRTSSRVPSKRDRPDDNNNSNQQETAMAAATATARGQVDLDDILMDSSASDDDDDDDPRYGSKKSKSTSSSALKKTIKQKKARRSPVPGSLLASKTTTTPGSGYTTSMAQNSSSSSSSVLHHSTSKILTSASSSGPSSVKVGMIHNGGGGVSTAATTHLELGNNSTESPPQGTLSTLWYSREPFVHVYVVEKILAWKKRPITQLEWIAVPTVAVDSPDPADSQQDDSHIDEDGMGNGRNSNRTIHNNTMLHQSNYFIDPSLAAKYSQRALTNPLIWRDPTKRMEFSRLNHQQCPMVMTIAVEAQHHQHQQKEEDDDEYENVPSTTTSIDVPPPTTPFVDPTIGPLTGIDSVGTMTGAGHAPPDTSDGPTVNRIDHAEDQQVKVGTVPMFRIKPVAVVGKDAIEREEVYLVKWRGKSHLHASWERPSDIIRMDQSNNTARSKIRRFVQGQEVALGLDWKHVLEAERAAAATVTTATTSATTMHGPGEHGNRTGMENATEETTAVDDEYLPPAVTEVERILACDESEMDLNFYSKQRAMNLLDEQDQMQLKERGKVKKWNSKDGLKELLTEPPWDPEDNVRYVVKWKGLPFAEMTWEYWRDIKRDAVDEAEDFWLRQKPPDEESIARSIHPHPHMQYFRKIQESPSYGMSKTKRPVAETVNGRVVPRDDEDESSNQGFQLRSYQLEGVNWLLFNWWNRRSCILADEMGLGKTIQSVGFLKLLQDLPTTCVRGPFLIVAPLSLIGQWQSEAKSWAPDLNVVLYHGSADARDFLVQQDFFYTDQFVPKATAAKLRKQHVTKFHILITTYEVVLKDVEVFTKIKWKTLIVDEAHRLKNSKSKLFEELSSVPRDFCILLTGTPLANATEELWALLNFADRDAFDSKEDFLEKFGQLTDADQVNELHSVLKPYLLRRVKEDVEKSLPPKEETILEVSLTPIQKKYYKAIYERNTMFLNKGAKPNNTPSLMNVMMELRKCCNHPFLVRSAEERILTEAAEQMVGGQQDLDYTKLFWEQFIKSSGKMVLMNKLLPKLFANGHKVLIFSQMVRMLDLLEELLKLKRYKYERLDGSTASSSRAAAVDRFGRKSCQRFVMLLSTRAGGLGLNLTAADIVIIFDSDWNPQNDLQAMARAHRIGQTRAVRVYRLLTAKTYEMHMFHSLSMKLGLERAVLSQQRDQAEEEGGKSKSKSEKEAQAREIDQLLKKGAYDIFRDDDDDEAKKFMETDIDQLMESSAKTVTYGQQQNKVSNGLGSFSKASFVTDTGDGEKDVDLDDPDFWTKAVGLQIPVETPEEISRMLDDGVKRSRKQVEQFDPYAEFIEIEQRKQAKIAMKIQAEKEEKDRLRGVSKKKKKRKEMENRDSENIWKEKKLKISSHGNENTNESGDSMAKTSSNVPWGFGDTTSLTLGSPTMTSHDPKDTTDTKPRNLKVKKVSDRNRALRRAENEDPAIERLKQAWDIPQRNRAVAACLRFGFGRFTKIRNESNLQSLPIQDFEVFFRSYFYQQSLQLAVFFLQQLQDGHEAFCDENLSSFLLECLGFSSSGELEWLSDCLSKGMQYYLDVEGQSRYLRLPLVLAEPSYVADLRRGPALRSLRRIHLLCRIGRIVEDCLDDAIAELGYEQLGQRGCQTSTVSCMDVDLKSRLVSTEELMLAVNSLFRRIDHSSPVIWWDRSCDIALLIGTFVHGLGNYEAMLNDDTLPFAEKIRRYARVDKLSVEAHRRFLNATLAAKQVCDDALEASKLKARKEVQAAVAAAAAASTKIEKEALALREGGTAAEAVISTMGEQRIDNLYEIQEGQDAHFITLPRLKRELGSSVRLDASILTDDNVVEAPDDVKSQSDVNVNDDLRNKRRGSSRHPLPMPDARILDFRLQFLVSEIERLFSAEDGNNLDIGDTMSSPKVWPASEIVSTNLVMRDRVLRNAIWNNDVGLSDQVKEYAGIGVNGKQCGVNHRSLDDRSDFSLGAASSDLSQVANGPDAPRYLRAIGVPITLTRFGISGLLHADEKCLNAMLANEHAKYYGDSNNERTSDWANNTAEEANMGSPPKVDLELPTDSSTTSKVAQEDHDMPRVFRDRAELRAAICAVILFYGYPFTENGESEMYRNLWTGFREQCGHFDDTPPESLFHATRFESLLTGLCSSGDIPTTAAIKDYVEKCFLPHCLKLCLYGNGPTTKNARGSKGEYETASGTSRYPEPSHDLQSPFPDPCLPLTDQSIEAVGTANAVLRRVRLMRSILLIASGRVSAHKIQDILHSRSMRQSMTGLPVWWCPWIHDVALLIHASTRGLFSIFKDRDSSTNVGPAFSPATIMHHIHSSFLGNEQVTPREVLDASSPDDSTAWMKVYAKEFPSLKVVERRLLFLCAKATEELDGDDRFDNLPTYDHGGWPRN